jgi:hypothetical protein
VSIRQVGIINKKRVMTDTLKAIRHVSSVATGVKS